MSSRHSIELPASESTLPSTMWRPAPFDVTARLLAYSGISPEMTVPEAIGAREPIKLDRQLLQALGDEALALYDWQEALVDSPEYGGRRSDQQ